MHVLHDTLLGVNCVHEALLGSSSGLEKKTLGPMVGGHEKKAWGPMVVMKKYGANGGHDKVLGVQLWS